MFRNYLVALLISVIVVFVFLYRINIQFDYRLITDLLQDAITISSFVFAVTGVWLGIANPKVMSDLFRVGYSLGAHKKENTKFSLIFLPLKYSIVNLCLSLLLLITIRILSYVMIDSSFKIWLIKNVFLSLSLMVNGILVFAILATVIPAYIIQQNAKSSAIKNDAFEETTKR